ncbi:late embryogenesis abundant protein [Carex rostrata]
MFVRVLGGIGGSALQLKPYRAARSNPVNRRYDRAAYCAVPSASPGESEGELKMDKEEEARPHTEQQHDQSKTHTDVMTDSFGVGYSTRCDEEGFGCIYRDNDPVNHPEYDKSQGSEVKEKEKARNLKHGDHTK